MHNLYRVKDMLIEEIACHGDDKELTTESLKEIDMLAHAAKNVCKVIDSCLDEEYSGRRYGREYGASYGRKRDSMGRFSRDDGASRDMSRESSFDEHGVSYGGDKQRIIAQLEQMMAVSDDRTRGKFRELIRDMRNA